MTVSKITKDIRVQKLSCFDEENCALNIQDLRYLDIKYYDKTSNIHDGQLLCNKFIASDLDKIFCEFLNLKIFFYNVNLFENCVHDLGEKVFQNVSYCYKPYDIAVSENISKHALGLALDLYPVKDSDIEQVIQIFKKYGFEGDLSDENAGGCHFEVSNQFLMIIYPKLDLSNPNTLKDKSAFSCSEYELVPLTQTIIFKIIIAIVIISVMLISVSFALTATSGG